MPYDETRALYRQFTDTPHRSHMSGDKADSDAVRSQLRCVSSPAEEHAGAAAALLSRADNSKACALRFFLAPDAHDLHEYRLSGIFESHPEVDHIVIGVIRNGYETASDLHTRTLREVFNGVRVTIAEQRWFIEMLKSHLGLQLAY